MNGGRADRMCAALIRLSLNEIVGIRKSLGRGTARQRVRPVGRQAAGEPTSERPKPVR